MKSAVLLNSDVGHGVPVPPTLTLFRSASMNIYRRLYEQHFGPIPKDSEGRTYDIHHIDGNRKNNDPSNLVALTIQEHYDIHHKQHDWGACFRISQRLNRSAEEQSELARKIQKKRVEEGTHNWLDGDKASEREKEKVRNGTHHFLGESNPSIKRMKDGTHQFCDNERQRQLSQNITKKRLADGTHNFLGPETNRKRIDNGTHNFLKKLTCPVCNKSMSEGLYNRWGHGENCKGKV